MKIFPVQVALNIVAAFVVLCSSAWAQDDKGLSLRERSGVIDLGRRMGDGAYRSALPLHRRFFVISCGLKVLRDETGQPLFDLKFRQENHGEVRDAVLEVSLGHDFRCAEESIRKIRERDPRSEIVFLAVSDILYKVLDNTTLFDVDRVVISPPIGGSFLESIRVSIPLTSVGVRLFFRKEFQGDWIGIRATYSADTVDSSSSSPRRRHIVRFQSGLTFGLSCESRPDAVLNVMTGTKGCDSYR